MEPKILLEYATRVRRRLHTHPELSMQEKETTAFLADELIRMGYSVKEWDDLTGCTAFLKGDGAGPTIAVRADIDALPIEEASGYPFPSQNKGVMHACCHDGHTAIAMAAAKYFAALQGKLHGNIYFIFQPGEEVLPGGAVKMLGKGVLKEHPVDMIFGLHHVTCQKDGTIGVWPGEGLLGFDSFTLTFHGASGYGYDIRMQGDAVTAAAEFVVAVQRDLSMAFPPEGMPAIVVRSLKGEDPEGGLAETVEVRGGISTFSTDSYGKLEDYIKDVAERAAKNYRASVETVYHHGYPPVVNDERAAAFVREAVEERLGPEHLLITRGPLTAADDMAYFTEQVPGCYFWWGVTREDQPDMHAHHANFCVYDEQMLPAILVMTGAVEKALKYFGGGISDAV